MGKRLSLTAWNYFKKQYPNDVASLHHFDVTLNKYNIFNNHYMIRFNRKSTKTKTNLQRYGLDLGPIIDWLDENINDQYYIDIDHKAKDMDYNEAVIRFYFMEETDALAFMLMFGEKT